MKVTIRLLCTFVLASSLLACASKIKTPQLELREYQTRTYQGKTTPEIFHAVLNTLQDDGFVIDVADIESGLVKANVSNTKLNGRDVLQSAAYTIFSAGFYLLFTDGNMEDVENLNATITISPYGKSMKVRTSFVFRRDNSDGETVEHRQIDDKEMYQKFYSSIEKSIFLDESLQPQ